MLAIDYSTDCIKVTLMASDVLFEVFVEQGPEADNSVFGFLEERG